MEVFSAEFHVDGMGHHNKSHHSIEHAMVQGMAHGMVHGAAHVMAHGMEHSLEHSLDLHHDKHHHNNKHGSIHVEVHHDKHHNSLEHAVVHGAAHAMVHGTAHAMAHGMEHSLNHSLELHHDKHHDKHHHNKVHIEGDVVMAAAAVAATTHAVAEVFAAAPVFPSVIPAIIPSIIPAIVPIVEFIDRSNRVYITLNQPSYVAGDIVNGTVELDCLVPFFAKGVLLKVKGFERVWWEYQETEYEGEGQNRKAITRTKERKENKEFFRDTIRVYPQQGTVGAGHFSFPFTYQLPPNLPGTYCEEGGHHGNRYHAKVLYKLKATLDVAFRHDLHSTTRLVVNEKFDRLVQPSFAENSKSFLTSTGNLHIRTWLDKNAYFPGETVMTKLKANNTSVKPTRKIVVKVVHCLELRAHGHHHRVSHVEYEQQFSGFEPCYYGVKWMPFNIPVGLVKPSVTQGHHVFSSYLLHIECDIPAATDLSVALPLRILAPQFLFSAAPPQPVAAILPPPVLIRPPWQPDAQASSCNSCKAGFTLFNRRHHCRHCAKVYCGKCVSQKVPIAKLKYKDPVRVCGGCMPTAQSGGKKYQSTKEIMAQWKQTQPGYVPDGASSPVLALSSAPPM